MSLPLYEYREDWIGTGDTTAYTFNFKIAQPQYLLAIVLDNNGNEQFRVRGTDTSIFIQSLVYDSINGGGTVTLLQVLPSNWTVTFFSANDWPTQPFAFPNKGSFSLSIFEQALDALMAPVQRLASQVQRSLKLYDLDNTGAGVNSFNPTLPPNAWNNPGAVITISADGTTLAFGATVAQIAAAAGYASTASTAAANAAASAGAAATSAAAAAQSAIEAEAGFAVTPNVAQPPNSPTAITALGGFSVSTAPRQLQFVHGSGGPVTIASTPQVAAGQTPGQELTIIGCDDTNTITVTQGQGLNLNGNMTIGSGDVLGLIWDGINWCEIYRRSAT